MSEKVKLLPHRYARMVNDVLETALKYQGTQQLRAQLSRTLSKYVEPDHKNGSVGTHE